MQRTLKNGLYHVLLPRLSSKTSNNFSFIVAVNSILNSSSCFNSIVSLNNFWHMRLGHPAPLIMNKVAKQCNNSFSITSTSYIFYIVCQLGKNHRLFASSSLSKVPNLLNWFYLMCGDQHLFNLLKDINIMY